MSEEKSFEVVDRRRVGQQATPGGEETESPAAESAATESAAAEAAETGPAGFNEEPLGGLDGQMPDLGVDGILRMAIGLLHERAWIDLGLQGDPITGQIQAKLPDARRAIDAVADLAKYVDATATPEEKRELQVMLTNLRVNYVRLSQG
ncbi:MAG: DUF1844 domain-containing protein [Armatimonadota bacterium]